MAKHKYIPTWLERCDKHPDHAGVVTHGMIQARMQEEIDDLRDELVKERIRCLAARKQAGAYSRELAKLGGG